MELGLAALKHAFQVGPAEAALVAAAGFAPDGLEVPAACARERQQLRERDVAADALGDQDGGHPGNIERKEKRTQDSEAWKGGRAKKLLTLGVPLFGDGRPKARDDLGDLHG